MFQVSLCVQPLWHDGPEQEKIQAHMKCLTSTVLANVGVSWCLRLKLESMKPSRGIGFWKVAGT